MKTDYEYMALSLANLSGLPVRLYKNGKLCKLYHHTIFKPDPAAQEEKEIFKNKASVSYYMTDTLLFYGLFRDTKTEACLLVGPVPAVRFSRNAVNRILRSMGEPLSRCQELMDYLHALPSYPLNNFMQILCTINYFINGEKINVSDLLLGQPAKDLSREILKDQALLETFSAPLVPPSGEYIIHNTLELERQLLASVEHGRTKEILALYNAPPSGKPGIMAGDALRQEQNLLICTITLVTRAAIRGGLDPETAFALSDIYIQKSEMQTDYVEVSRLLAQAVLDFTRRVSELDHGVKNSALVRRIRDYVLNHISETISTQQLALALKQNRTYLCRTFKEDAHMTINAYVTQIKMDEACRLLENTKKTLAEISEYLGFSSQSYFQNVFRRHTGMTPATYRSHKDGSVRHFPML